MRIPKKDMLRGGRKEREKQLGLSLPIGKRKGRKKEESKYLIKSVQY